MSVVKFDQKFTALSSCVTRTQLFEEEKSQIFDEILVPRYRYLV